MKHLDNAKNPASRLLAVKAAIHQVTRQMEKENLSTETVSTDDKLGATMTFLRAAEGPHVKMGIMRKCAKIYPKLNDVVDTQCPILGATGEIKKVRDHAVELSRQCIQEELAD